METVIAILIYLNVLAPAEHYTAAQVKMLEKRHKPQIEIIKKDKKFTDSLEHRYIISPNKTVWDHEEL